MQFAALFLILYSIALSLSPAARLRSWDLGALEGGFRWNHWIGLVIWLVGSGLLNRQIIRRYPERDPFLFPVIALLSGWGLLTIWRLDAEMGLRQTIWLALCLLVMWAGLYVPNLLALLRRYKYLWLTGALLLTGLTFLVGTYPGGEGPRLWLGCCGMYLQPSEPLKLLLIVYLAAYLADNIPIGFNLTSLLIPTLIMAGMALALLVTQRDLGTASLFILIYTVIIYLASGKRRVLIISALIITAAGVAGYMLFGVVRLRVDSWLNPWLDPSGRSYQIVQSIIAVAAGDFIGRGPGLGNPGVVPVTHSDFIIAAIAEESGMLGVIALIGLYALIVGRGFRIAMFAPNNYQRFLAGGLTAYLTIQAILIMGGNLRLLPLTGVTLPFVSYGGSSLLTVFIASLLLLLVSAPDEHDPAPLPRPGPYLLVSASLLAALAALAVVTGWWAVVRDGELLTRADNPRRTINDRYVRRGTLFDRDNNPIHVTVGQPGSLSRSYEYPPLGATTGYNSAQYGQGGLESGLDDYLRGLRGNPASLISWDYMLYGQPPPGLNVRLTLDMDIQRLADELLAGHKGALVLLNAANGEILAIGSHPGFDPGEVDARWPELVQSQDAPLLNRATQGQYPPGTSLGPFLLAYAAGRGTLPPPPSETGYNLDGTELDCALPPGSQPPWGELVSKGCPGALVRLAQRFQGGQLADLFASLGFYTSPDLPLQVAGAQEPDIEQVDRSAIGQENLTVTPLQMALAAATLSSQGIRPAPQIAGAVQTPQQGWIALPTSDTQETLVAGSVIETAQALAMTDAPFWQTVATAQANQSPLTWYLAGTLPQWQGAPLALALVLEEDNPELAAEIGNTLLQGAIE